MKKNLVSLVSLAFLVGLVSLTSCKKEETQGNGTQFRATMEGCTSVKTTLNGTALNWVSGDQIAVYGTVGCGIYNATPQSPATVAVFDNVSGETGDATFRAFYPSTLTTDGVGITLPATQTYVEGSINEFPMYAESSNNELAFKNLCGVLKLHLTKANTSISSITITAASEINGSFSVDYNNGDPELTYSANGTNTTTLTCTTAQSIAEGKDFYIYLPEGSYSGLQIEMNTDDNRYCVKTANTAINVTRSQYTLITLGESNLNFVEPLPEGALTGLFSVSATQQVYFSSGNLQYQASTDTWRFAEHQYDYIGSANNNRSATYSGWIDLFGWGTSGYNHGAISYMPYSTGGSNANYYAYGNSGYDLWEQDGTADWGYNAISNGGNSENQWRTLTNLEWNYLFNTRPNASDKKGIGNINGINGVILLPDNWTLPSNCTFTSGVSSSSDDWSRNSYSLSQWIEMEANGAVFLPAAGYRGGNGNYSGSGRTCYVWTSSHYNANVAYYVTCGATYISIGNYSANTRNFTYPVRLVQND